ncbi:hypothetical protein [Mycolicibacterium gilvum]|uniref:hypothetical protein n=1 Tax=Mycolicibacterium gilvum TaxID=1804 RepID=UPI0040451FA1
MAAVDGAGFGDYRRAALLIRYGRLGETAGIAAIIAETNELERSPQLLKALLELNRSFIGRLRTSEGIELLGDYIENMSRLDVTKPPGIDIRRAARIINSYMSDDMAGIDTEMHAASREIRATETLRQIMDTFEAALPELNSQVGLQWLQTHVGLAPM